MWKSVIYLFLPNSWYCESTVSLVPTQNKMLGFAFFFTPSFLHLCGSSYCSHAAPQLPSLHTEYSIPHQGKELLVVFFLGFLQIYGFHHFSPFFNFFSPLLLPCSIVVATFPFSLCGTFDSSLMKEALIPINNWIFQKSLHLLILEGPSSLMVHFISIHELN